MSAKSEALDALLALPANAEPFVAAARIELIRSHLLTSPLPSPSPSRPLLWKLFLSLTSPISAAAFYSLTTRDQPSHIFAKIKGDSFRTMATDEDFKANVSEDKLVRGLEAFVWRQLDLASSGATCAVDASTPYVQGMNVLLAPFLFVMPSELEAFACFCAFIENQAPLYVLPTLSGVHAGLQLVDKCMEELDGELYRHLLSCKLTAELYAFPSVLTLSACSPPLAELVALWDFLLAYGVGLNVLCVVAQVHQIRHALLGSTSKLLRTFPNLNAKVTIATTVQFVAELSPELYDAVVRHPWDKTLETPAPLS